MKNIALDESLVANIKHLKHCHFVCMKNIALDESLVANIYSTMQSLTMCYICHSTLYFLYKLAAVI